MSAFKDRITQERARNANPSLEDAFWAGRRYLHEMEIISRSKMLQLSGMTVAELNRAIDELEMCER